MSRITTENDHFANIKLKKDQKKQMNLISWWKERKCKFPYLFKAVRALLCAPATSVPSEWVF